jgi:hypothetical protein
LGRSVFASVARPDDAIHPKWQLCAFFPVVSGPCAKAYKLPARRFTWLRRRQVEALFDSWRIAEKQANFPGPTIGGPATEPKVQLPVGSERLYF